MTEEDWIAKYRAALIATQIKPSRAETIIAGLKAITQEFVLAIAKAPHGKTKGQLDEKPFEELRCPTLARAPGSEHNAQGRAGSSTRDPGKPHLSSRTNRRKAS